MEILCYFFLTRKYPFTICHLSITTITLYLTLPIFDIYLNHAHKIMIDNPSHSKYINNFLMLFFQFVIHVILITNPFLESEDLVIFNLGDFG
jgi:hypothetical protein